VQLLIGLAEAERLNSEYILQYEIMNEWSSCLMSVKVLHKKHAAQ